jgi:hypothetical protein
MSSKIVQALIFLDTQVMATLTLAPPCRDHAPVSVTRTRRRDLRLIGVCDGDKFSILQQRILGEPHPCGDISLLFALTGEFVLDPVL